MSEVKAENFVTVVAVGTALEQDGGTTTSNENINFDSNSPGYVTVLTIGNTENNNKVLKDVTEEVIVYRLPGERLGFGLKFEGGTKASEYVKRLFIQSCASDSPASRVKSSWGKLTEGDEVLEIDSTPVNTMTRIDCVRCLKDSNVAIKLLVRHIYENRTTKIDEELLPSIVSAEEKRSIVPPPPPPVPPRKIPRKMLKTFKIQKEHEDNIPQDNNNVTSKQTEINCKPKILQSPRSSLRSYYSSPDEARKDRNLSDGNLGPPDAEVYVDLFLQESTQSLSESDETGSTISTVIDRFGSFPTTTSSSFAGSLPSTPSVQKKLDMSNVAVFDYEEHTTNKINTKQTLSTREENNNIISDEVNPLCFQDAPLSYGNENTKIIVPDEPDGGQKEEPIVAEEITKSQLKKPPVPPRSRDTVLSSVSADSKKSENLPRLVDFVPKTLKENNIENNSAEIMKLFLENERYKSTYPDYDINDNDSNNMDTYNNGIDLYSSKWSLSSQLATIGEVEEESGNDFNFNRPALNATPVVIVENADSNEHDKQGQTNVGGMLNNKESDGIMETLPSDPRQPPDGHEFPDFIEHNTDIQKQNYYKEMEPTFSTFSTEYKLQSAAMEECPKVTNSSNLILSQTVSASNSDLRPVNRYDSNEDLVTNEPIPEPSPLHTRSQSLIDMSALSKQKNAKWNQLFEQRRKGLSKLKGLVIPESSEIETTPLTNPIHIPEIKSHKIATFASVPKVDNSYNNTTATVAPSNNINNNTNDVLISSIVLPPWSPNLPSSLPKYSPAFKRRSLQVYPTNTNKIDNIDYISNSEFPKYCDNNKSTQRVSKLSSDDDMNPPKSLESISSPTRSDCSFDYVSSSTKKYAKETTTDILQKAANKLEDESDNDSAVSSSQSSYNSRFSPPPSPTRSSSCDEDYRNAQRLLKPSSVEAINRKNILASAKCRSGKDIKIGSPVIKRKTEDAAKTDEEPIVPNIITKDEESRCAEPSRIEASEAAWEEASPSTLSTAPSDSTSVSTPPVTPPASPLVSPPVSPEVQPVPSEILKIPSSAITSVTPEAVTTTEKETPPQRVLRTSFIPTPSPSKPARSTTENVKLNKTQPRDLYSSSSSILNRKPQPINVKALKASFENFGTSPPPMPQKVPNYKSQIAVTTPRSVKANIAKAETDIANATASAAIGRKSEPIGETKRKDIISKLTLEPKKSATSTIVKDDVKQVGGIARKSLITVVLKVDTEGTSLGITLAGGIDEDKEITIHRIRYGSIAYHDGRLKKGDKIISVNEKPTKGLKHSEATELLKQKVTEFTFQIEEGIEPLPSTPSNLSRRSSSISTLAEIKPAVDLPEKTPNHVIKFDKNGAGLGFSIEGGKDSPMGDVPLLVKKIFTGGSADKNGELKVGDQIIMVNDIKFTNLTRIEAWNLMKKIPDGNVHIHVFR